MKEIAVGADREKSDFPDCKVLKKLRCVQQLFAVQV